MDQMLGNSTIYKFYIQPFWLNELRFYSKQKRDILEMVTYVFDLPTLRIHIKSYLPIIPHSYFIMLLSSLFNVFLFFLFFHLPTNIINLGLNPILRLTILILYLW